MNILIVGLGYAGNRFLRAFRYLDEQGHFHTPVKLAYVGRTKRDNTLQHYFSLSKALVAFNPQIVVVTVNDENHAGVLSQLRDYTGHVVCEKPLVTAIDDLDAVNDALSGVSGFSFDLIERYSLISTSLKNFILEQRLKLLRTNFHWGKDRINDRRPTCGATSEIIHALDLIQWLCPNEGQFKLQDVSGVMSDFSVSGNQVIDTVIFSSRLGNAVVTGYSSFVNIVRQRTVDLVFANPSGELVYARMIFDTPNWDEDNLRVWKRLAGGQETELLSVSTEESRTGTALHTIYKLVHLCQDVLDQVYKQAPPSISSADLTTALSLQRQLNEIDRRANLVGPVKYVQGSKRTFTQDESSLEGLG